MRNWRSNLRNLGGHVSSAVISLILLACFTPVVLADLRHDGRSQHVGPSDNTLRWVKSFEPRGPGFIREGVIFRLNLVGGRLGPEGTIIVIQMLKDHLLLHAFSPDGELKWEKEVNGFLTMSRTTLYFRKDNEVRALNFDNTIRWTCKIDGGPVYTDDNTTWVMTFGNNVIYLYEIDVDGKIKWFYPIDVSGESPLVGRLAADDFGVYFHSPKNLLVALDRKGRFKWSYPVEVGAPVLGDNGMIYYVSENTLLALSHDGKLRWHRTFPEEPSDPAISKDGTLYVPCGNNLYVLTPDGTLIWGWLAENKIGVSTVDREGNIYFTTPLRLYSLTSDGHFRWVFKFDTPISQEERPIIGEDGTLYLICTDEIYAFGSIPTEKTPFRYQGLVMVASLVVVLAVMVCLILAKRRLKLKHIRR